MIFFLLLLIIITLYKCKFNFKNFNKDYLSIEKTKCINGFFVIIIFLSHVKKYFTLEDIWYNSYYLKINTFIGQLMVTTFLFFSGFGIMESIRNKKEKYVNSIPKKRILNTFINFDFAVLLFLLCNLFIGKKYNLSRLFLSFMGWSSIGNSSWYIFAILILYAITWICFKVFDKNNLKGIIGTTILSLFFISFLKLFKEPYWYNTILCYPAGMLFSHYKNKIENLICENNKTYLFISAICITTFILLYKFSTSLLIYELLAILFVVLILLLCMKFSFKNKILNYLGNNVFWIYMLQRIPMMLLRFYKVHKYNQFLFVIICFILTILLTELVKLFFKLFGLISLYLKNNFKRYTSL